MTLRRVALNAEAKDKGKEKDKGLHGSVVSHGGKQFGF
jgi:hypothetical protein